MNLGKAWADRQQDRVGAKIPALESLAAFRLDMHHYVLVFVAKLDYLIVLYSLTNDFE